jgi:hypothetical protein
MWSYFSKIVAMRWVQLNQQNRFQTSEGFKAATQRAKLGSFNVQFDHAEPIYLLLFAEEVGELEDPPHPFRESLLPTAVWNISCVPEQYGLSSRTHRYPTATSRLRRIAWFRSNMGRPLAHARGYVYRD